MVLRMQLGEKLKEARLEKGYTIEDIETMTRIQARHLQAIEDNNFSYIPGNFYARVFIKEYAQVVGLDYNALLVEHESEMPKSDNEIDYSQLRKTRRKSSSGKTSSVARFIPTFIVILLLFGVVFFIWQTALNPNRLDNNGNNGDTQTDQSAGDQVSVPPTDEPDEPDETDETDEQNNLEEDVGEDPEAEEVIEEEIIFISYENSVSYYQFNTTEEEIELVIESSGSNWLEIESDAGESLYYATLHASASPVTVDVSDYEHVYLRFGNPGDISMSINEVEIDLSDEIAPTAVQQLWLYINEEPE